MWTMFWDMYSGGSLKQPPYSMIFIQAPEDEATLIFYNRFSHNPNDTACGCCGNNYSIYSEESLRTLTAYHRNCDTGYVYMDTDEEVPDIDVRAIKYINGERVYNGRPVDNRPFERPDYSMMEYGRSKEECDAAFVPFEKFVSDPDPSMLILHEADIHDFERVGDVPDPY